MFRHTFLITALLLTTTFAQAQAARSASAEMQLQKALGSVTDELQTQPDSAPLLFERAVILTKLGDYPAAIEAYQAITELRPELPEPMNNLAVIHASQQNYQAAERSLKQAIATHPSYSTAQQNLTEIYKQLAATAYNRALGQKTTNTARSEPPLALIESLPQISAAPDKETFPAQRGETTAAIDPTPRLEKENPADITTVAATIDSWAGAWAAQDVSRYLAHYDNEFTPPDDLSLPEWQELRKQRLTSPAFIEVQVDQPHIQLLDNTLAGASFKQHFRSNTFAEISSKQLLLKWHENQWKIIQEFELK